MFQKTIVMGLAIVAGTAIASDQDDKVAPPSGPPTIVQITRYDHERKQLEIGRMTVSTEFVRKNTKVKDGDGAVRDVEYHEAKPVVKLTRDILDVNPDHKGPGYSPYFVTGAKVPKEQWDALLKTGTMILIPADGKPLGKDYVKLFSERAIMVLPNVPPQVSQNTGIQLPP